MKQVYKKPWLQIEFFEGRDVICQSAFEDEDGAEDIFTPRNISFIGM